MNDQGARVDSLITPQRQLSRAARYVISGIGKHAALGIQETADSYIVW